MMPVNQTWRLSRVLEPMSAALVRPAQRGNVDAPFTPYAPSRQRSLTSVVASDARKALQMCLVCCSLTLTAGCATGRRGSFCAQSATEKQDEYPLWRQMWRAVWYSVAAGAYS